MSKFPFTPSGFISLQSELNDLKPSKLAIKVAAISCNTIDWIKENFVLDAKQIKLLDHINPRVIDFIASQTLLAIKLSNGPLGPFTGRIGNLICYELNGQTIIRTIGRKKKPPTPQIKTNRMTR